MLLRNLEAQVRRAVCKHQEPREDSRQSLQGPPASSWAPAQLYSTLQSRRGSHPWMQCLHRNLILQEKPTTRWEPIQGANQILVQNHGRRNITRLSTSKMGRRCRESIQGPAEAGPEMIEIIEKRNTIKSLERRHEARTGEGTKTGPWRKPKGWQCPHGKTSPTSPTSKPELVNILRLMDPVGVKIGSTESMSENS